MNKETRSFMARGTGISLALAALALLLASCRGGGGVRTVEITQRDDGCVPVSVSVKPGQRLRIVVKNESSQDAYEVEGIDGTELEEFGAPKGATRSADYTVPAGVATHKLKCYVAGGPATIIELVAGGPAGSGAASPESGATEAEEGGSTVVPHADPDPEATSIAEVAFDITDFSQAPDDQSFTLTNQSGFAVDLGGWTVAYHARVSSSLNLPTGFVLSPGQSVRVHTRAGANTATDVYLGLPAGVAGHAYTAGDEATGFIDIEAAEGQGYFRYILPTPTPVR